ncbi:maltose permease Mal31p [[Candida] jaroonii]|uniref:Maltose permease Mal31p n=1 Tax=[Candida] jaroonii TaxID=467808 RepID=A0ACA9YD43_9ASCO|nr:maltose permease Mal31p [[Candida] jaroonii]
MVAEHIEDVSNPKNTEVVEKLDKYPTDTSLEAGVEDYISKFLEISDDAKNNDKKDKVMPLKEGLRTFPKAAIWSVVLSTALIMEGYDTNLLNSLYAMPAFKEKYGQPVPNSDDHEIPSNIQITLSMCVNVGEVLGLALAGVVADKLGYRWTLIVSLFFTTCFIFIVFFAQNVGMLIAGELLLGIPWGFFQTLTISYAAEVCPLVLRIYLTTYVNACWVIGQLISSGILRAFVGDETALAYRVPFAIQWVWPIPIALGIFLAPESPWWLVRKGKLAQAKKSLSRLISENKYCPDKAYLLEAMVNKMQLTITEENIKSQTESSYFDCFKGRDLRRTRVAAITWLIQNITGSALMGYSTYFYVQAGLSTSMSFTFSIIQYVLGLIGTISSWFLSQKMGRFDIYFMGLCFNCCILLIVGGLATSSNPNASWGIGSLLLVYTFMYDLTVGPLCYCIVAELPSAKLRTKTIIIARNVYNISGIITAIITPKMLNPTDWNWGAKTGFFWAGFCFCSAIWCWFELPETKGRTFAELDLLFHNKIPARKFKKTDVEIFDAGELIEIMGEEGVKKLVVANETKAEV